MTPFLLTRDKLLLDSSSRARTSGDEARNANYTLLNLQVAGNRPRVKIARRLRRGRRRRVHRRGSPMLLQPGQPKQSGFLVVST